MSKRLVLFLISLTLITSCGFRLRGNFDVPETLSKVSIAGGDRELVGVLTELLRKSGATVVASAIDAPSINITKSEFNRRILASNDQGIATSFKFHYRIAFNLTDAEGGVLQKSVSLNQVRDLFYEAGNELEVEDEEAFLKKEMEKEIALQIMRRLTRL